MSCNPAVATLLLACLVVGRVVTPAAATGADTALVVLEAGERGGAHAVLTFDTAASPERLTLRTHAAGVVGSRLTISVDRSPVAAFSHFFTTEECRFPAGGPSVCELVLTADHPAHAVIVESFRRGREAHVTVQDAGVTAMRRSVSLLGFTRRLAAAAG